MSSEKPVPTESTKPTGPTSHEHGMGPASSAEGAISIVFNPQPESDGGTSASVDVSPGSSADSEQSSGEGVNTTLFCPEIRDLRCPPISGLAVPRSGTAQAVVSGSSCWFEDAVFWRSPALRFSFSR